MSYRIEAASKEEWAERAFAAERKLDESEAKLAKVVHRLRRLESLIGDTIHEITVGPAYTGKNRGN